MLFKSLATVSPNPSNPALFSFAADIRVEVATSRNLAFFAVQDNGFLLRFSLPVLLDKESGVFGVGGDESIRKKTRKSF